MSHIATEGLPVEVVTLNQPEDIAREGLGATQQAEQNNFQFIHNIMYHNTEELSHWLDHDGLMSVTVASEEIVTVPSHTSTREFYGITLIAEEQGNWSKDWSGKVEPVVGREWKGVDLVADERGCAEPQKIKPYALKHKPQTLNPGSPAESGARSFHATPRFASAALAFEAVLLSLRVEHVEREREREGGRERDQHPSTVHHEEGAVTDEAGGGGTVYLGERGATVVQVSAPESCIAECSGKGGECEGCRKEGRGSAWRDRECGTKMLHGRARAPPRQTWRVGRE